MHDEVSEASKWLISATGYTGLVVGIWSLPWTYSAKIPCLAILILIFILAKSVDRNIRTARILHQVRSENNSLAQRVEDLSYSFDLADGMVALAHTLTQAPAVDAENHYHEVVDNYRIDQDDATYLHELRGRRVLEGSGSGLMIKVSGDTPADASTMSAEATDRQTERPLSVTFIRDDPYLKVLRIEFDRPLAQGDEFHISLSLRWAGTFPRARKVDYVFSSWSIFAAQGIDRYSCTLSSDLQLENIVLEELSDGKRNRAKVQPKIVSRKSRCEASWSTMHPSSLYLLRFEKVLPE